MNSMYPQVVKDMEAYLKTYAFDFPGDVDDIDEESSEYVMDVILQGFNGEKASTCSWYNLVLNKDKDDVYCIVKVVGSKTINIHQKEALVHSLTSLDADDIDCDMSLNEMLKCIEDNLLDERDYLKECYFIFIDVNDLNVMVRSVCDVVSYQFNQDVHDNPDEILQIDWEKEKNVHKLECKSVVEIKVSILKVIAETIMHMVQSSAMFLKQFYNLELTESEH
jgi:hypothetical protein